MLPRAHNKKGKEEECSFCEIFQMHHVDSSFPSMFYSYLAKPYTVGGHITGKSIYSTGGRFCCHHSITGSALEASITSYPGSLGMKGTEA